MRLETSEITDFRSTLLFFKIIQLLVKIVDVSVMIYLFITFDLYCFFVF